MTIELKELKGVTYRPAPFFLESLLKPNPANTHGYITTFTGKKVSCPGMRSSMVNWQDISQSLSMQVRYLGHINKFYSVANHSVLCSQLAQAHREPLELVQACFMHDVHEAYVGDFPSPFKKAVPGLPLFEHGVEAAVRDALNLPSDLDSMWARVKHYDIVALHMEASQLFNQTPDWVDKEIVRLVPEGIKLRPLEWQEGKSDFLQRAQELRIV